MIKAVILDWFITLAHFDPPREEIFCRVFGELGIDIKPEQARRGILLADEYLYTESITLPVASRSLEERQRLYLQFPIKVMQESNLTVDEGICLKINKRIRELFPGSRYALFPDVMPTLEALKQRGLVIGVLTNLSDDINVICRNLGLDGVLDFAVASGQVGVRKPDAIIFQAALKKAAVSAEEAIYVGDQYKVDIIGARGVGINPVFIDRYNLYPDVNDCPRINSLAELVGIVS